MTQEIIPPGVYFDMAEERYRPAKGVSQTGLKSILSKSPAHYRYEQTAEKKDTAAFKFGRHFHNAVLLGHRDYVVKPEGIDGRSKDGKAWLAENAAKDILTSQEHKDIQGMEEALLANPDSRQWLEAGRAEVSMFSELQGVTVKGRIDYIPNEGNAIVDLKSCEDASPSGFQQSFTKFKYHVQAAMYLDLCRSLDVERDVFVFVCVEKSAPYCVAVYQVDQAAIMQGQLEYHKALAIYQNCITTGIWPGYPQGIQTVTLSPWKFKE
jgi:hypothetical protein